MFWKKSHVAVVIVMVVAALFGCQCGGPAIKAPGPSGPVPNPGPVAEVRVEGDPAEKVAADIVNKFGHVTQEGGKVVAVSVFKHGR
jgi:hypothetical protein